MLWTMCSKTFSFNMMRMRFFIQSLTFWRSITQSSVTIRSTIKNSWSLFALSRNDDQSLKILFILLRWSQIIKILSISCQLSSWVIIKLVEVSFCLNSTITSLIISTRLMISWMLWHVTQKIFLRRKIHSILNININININIRQFWKLMF